MSCRTLPTARGALGLALYLRHEIARHAQHARGDHRLPHPGPPLGLLPNNIRERQSAETTGREIEPSP